MGRCFLFQTEMITLSVSDSCNGSVHEIYVRQIDSTSTYLSHLIGYVNIFTMFLHFSSV